MSVVGWSVVGGSVVGGFNTTPTFQDFFSTKSPKNPYSRTYSKSEKYLGTFPGLLEFSGSVDTLNKLSNVQHIFDLHLENLIPSSFNDLFMFIVVMNWILKVH